MEIKAALFINLRRCLHCLSLNCDDVDELTVDDGSSIIVHLTRTDHSKIRPNERILDLTSRCHTIKNDSKITIV
jgi:hypothetical protein